VLIAGWRVKNSGPRLSYYWSSLARVRRIKYPRCDGAENRYDLAVAKRLCGVAEKGSILLTADMKMRGGDGIVPVNANQKYRPVARASTNGCEEKDSMRWAGRYDLNESAGGGLIRISVLGGRRDVVVAVKWSVLDSGGRSSATPGYAGKRWAQGQLLYKPCEKAGEERRTAW